MAMPAARAQDLPPERIRDNLFLLEEAYNQEPGVIQHISLFQYLPRAKQWVYSFTEEWPAPTDLNQLSVTLNLGGAERDGSTGLNDMLLNYRLQAVGLGGQGWIAMAPRLSLVLPTGSPEKMTGRGSVGLQLNLPVSMEAGRYVAVHLNAGATVTPGARSPAGRTATALDANAGAALVWQPVKWLNPLVEFSYTMIDEIGDDANARAHALVINPGLRFAIDHGPTGLQVVPGISVPMQVLPAAAFEVAALAYLSFEHPAF
ncbi:MAG: transporter [Deltaproteobacteria bacterium]|nr:transporter [Deltaproteobacteria bacterium]